jgi:hypothetical protein
MTPFLGINVCRQTIVTTNPDFENVSHSHVHMVLSHLSHAIGMCDRSLRLSLVFTTPTHSTVSTHTDYDRLSSYIVPSFGRRRANSRDRLYHKSLGGKGGKGYRERRQRETSGLIPLTYDQM